MQNKVTVFSNGIADLVKAYPVKAGEIQTISMPVRRDHIGDILGSFNLFGNVKLKSPPSYPSSENKNALNISPNSVWENLISSLAGAAIELTIHGGTSTPVKGNILGTETVQRGDAGTENYLLLMTNKGIVKCRFVDISNLNFTDEKIKAEIEKALNRKLQQIKPNSTFIEFTLDAAQEATEAVVQYTIPSAAWKITYRINQTKDAIELKGLAIVDNNTDEDWTDAEVSVVTGEPITFSTDLAQSKIPARGHVNVVSDRVASAIEAPVAKRASLQRMSNSCNEIMACSAAPMYDAYDATESCVMGFGGSAMSSEAEAKEVGDFAIFTTKTPVTIPANKSAVIPVFDAILRDAKTILHYNPKNNKERAYRSLSVTNSTAHSLGRGVCTLYQDNVYSGSCIFPATKQNQNQLLPYAIESGVRFNQNIETSNHTSQVTFKSGVCYYTDVNRIITDYQIENLKNEQFDVFVDYDLRNSNNKISATFNGEKISPIRIDNILRYELKLAANTVVELKVVEDEVLEENYQVVDQLDWTLTTFFFNDGVLQNKSEFKKLFELQTEIAKLQKENTKLAGLSSKANQKSNRVRENLKAVTQNEQRALWETELIASEKQISDLESQMQSISDKIVTLEEQINQFLSSITFTWAADKA